MIFLKISISVDNILLTPVETVTLLGIIIDYKLTFSSHISSICHKASNRIRNLNRIRSYLNLGQLHLLLNAYILSLFNYAPIVWMFCSKTSSRYIDTIHKRALRAVYQDFSMSHEELIQMSDLKRIHEVHLRFLLCEVFKTLHNLNPSFMQILFSSKHVSYNLRNYNLLQLPPPRSTRYGTQSFSFRGSLLWNNLPDNIKSKSSIQSFKFALKDQHLLSLCGCKICIRK